MPISHRTAGLGLFAACVLGTAAVAQPSAPEFFDQDPAEVAAAFTQPFGQLVLEEFAAVVQASANPACIREKGLQAAAVGEVAKRSLVQHGTEMVRILKRALSREAFETGFDRLAGVGAVAELDALRRDPDVRRYVDLLAPSRRAEMVFRVTENVDRVAIITRIPLARRVSPLASGDQRLLDADPSGDAGAAADAYAAEVKSPRLTRFIELYEMAERALRDSSMHDLAFVNPMGPTSLMPGLEDDLAALCVRVPGSPRP